MVASFSNIDEINNYFVEIKTEANDPTNLETEEDKRSPLNQIIVNVQESTQNLKTNN